MCLGTRLKELRTEFGLTQQDLGQKLNLGKSTISQYENNINTPDIQTLKTIAKIFNTSVDYLLGNTNIKAPIETIAFHRTDDPMSDLPEDARKSVEEFIAFVKKKYGQDKKTK